MTKKIVALLISTALLAIIFGIKIFWLNPIEENRRKIIYWRVLIFYIILVSAVLIFSK